MIASSVPGISADVLNADIAARIQLAQEREHITQLARELGEGGARTGHAPRSRRLRTAGRRALWRLHHFREAARTA